MDFRIEGLWQKTVCSGNLGLVTYYLSENWSIPGAGFNNVHVSTTSNPIKSWVHVRAFAS